MVPPGWQQAGLPPGTHSPPCKAPARTCPVLFGVPHLAGALAAPLLEAPQAPSLHLHLVMSQSLADVTGSSQARPGTHLRGQAGTRATMRALQWVGPWAAAPELWHTGTPSTQHPGRELEKFGDQAKLMKGARWEQGWCHLGSGQQSCASGQDLMTKRCAIPQGWRQPQRETLRPAQVCAMAGGLFGGRHLNTIMFHLLLITSHYPHRCRETGWGGAEGPLWWWCVCGGRSWAGAVECGVRGLLLCMDAPAMPRKGQRAWNAYLCTCQCDSGGLGSSGDPPTRATRAAVSTVLEHTSTTWSALTQDSTRTDRKLQPSAPTASVHSVEQTFFSSA